MKIVFGSTLSHLCFKLSRCWFFFSKIYFRSHFFALTSKSFSKRLRFNNIQKRLVKILIKKKCCMLRKVYLYWRNLFSNLRIYNRKETKDLVWLESCINSVFVIEKSKHLLWSVFYTRYDFVKWFIQKLGKKKNDT